ncbi:MAG: NAD-dependent epimerase/dehydratase family protein [Actinomycetota bacterium]
MRVAVTGITGQFGKALARVLEDEPAVNEVVGVARRPFDPADEGFRKLVYRPGDVRDPDLRSSLAGADVIVHLAFVIGGSRADQAQRRDINVNGSRNVFAATAEAGARKLIYASSIAAYGAHPDNPDLITEQHPTRGTPGVSYSQEKAEVEGILDLFEKEHPQVTVTRLRPCMVAGPGFEDMLWEFLPDQARRLPIFKTWFPRLFPNPIQGGRFLVQAVHEDDVAEAFRLAIVGDAPGAFNLAGEDVLGARDLANILKARAVPVPLFGIRQLVDVAHRIGISKVPGDWVDLVRYPILVDTTRARTQLGWEPMFTSAGAMESTANRLFGSPNE